MKEMMVKLDKEIIREKNNEKREKLNKDIKEIVEKRIELSEIEDFPYPLKHPENIRENVWKSINAFERQDKQGRGIMGFCRTLDQCIEVSVGKKDGGSYRVQIRFYPEKYDEVLKKAKEQTEEWIYKTISFRFKELAINLGNDKECLDEIIGEAETGFQKAEMSSFTERNRSVGIYLSKEDVCALQNISEFLKALRMDRYES